MVTPPKPPTPAPCTRIEWHCDMCHGDSVFDINEVNRPSAHKTRCLGCGHPIAFFLDAGVFQRHFRAHGTTEWEPR
jgi:hypothetical protein